MTDRQEQYRERAAQERGRKLRQIELIRAGTLKKHLEGETRLRAAQIVRSRYESLLKPKGPYSMSEITEHLENSEGINPGFKIHRWMLKKTEAEISPKLVAAYRARVEPQKKTRVYMNVVAALANLAGHDPDDAMIDFLDQTGLSDRLTLATPEQQDVELDPRLKLADLLRIHAAHTAEQFDFAALFAGAEHLQAGWNPDDGPNAVLLADAFQRLSAASVLSGAWLVDALPPVPAVYLASIPFGHIGDAGFVLGDEAEAVHGGPKEVARVRGSATAWWKLYLAITPKPSGGVHPCLLRTTRLTVMLDGCVHPEVDPGEYDVQPHQDALNELCQDHYREAWISMDQRRRITFDDDTSRRLARLEAEGTLYRNPRRNDATDETPPQETIPFARLVAVGPQSIQDWLLDDLDLAGAPVQRGPLLEPFEAAPHGARKLWMVGPSLARDLESAIRCDALQPAFQAWVADFRTSLAKFEEARMSEMAAEDAALRARWLAEQKDPQDDE